MKWCECDWPEEILEDNKYLCKICKGAIECEICGLVVNESDIKQAETRHIDYYICKEHESIAIDNVSSRI